MKNLFIKFLDTEETLLLDENCALYAWGNHADENLSTSHILEFDETLPDTLRKTPLMFYVYDDVAILKLYRSVYIDYMEWREPN